MTAGADRILRTIASEIRARPEQVKVAISLLVEGATVPFVARYRKEATGGLDDTQLRQLEERLAEAVRRIDELFEIERTINGKTPEQRVAVRQEKSKPLVLALDAWPREQRRNSKSHQLLPHTLDSV